MLRITQTPTVQITTIHLEGKLLSPWLDEVRSAIATAQTQGAVRVNLAGLSFVDPPGAVLLRNMRDDGIELIGVSGFVEGLLAQARQRT